MPPPRPVCVCSPCFPWEGSASGCPVEETVWAQGEREAGKILCQLPVLSCLLHSSSTAQCAQKRLPKPTSSGQERPPGSLSSRWTVILFWRIMAYSNCKSLDIVYPNVHGCFVLCVLTCEIMWLISYVPWISPPYENLHTQTTKFLYNIAAYFAIFYAFQSFWGWRLHQLNSTCVC